MCLEAISSWEKNNYSVRTRKASLHCELTCVFSVYQLLCWSSRTGCNCGSSFHHAESYALSGLLPFLNKTLHFPEFGNKVEGKLTCKTLPEAQRTWNRRRHAKKPKSFGVTSGYGGTSDPIALWQSCNISEKSIKKSIQLWKLISLSIFTENVSIFAWRFLYSSRMRRWTKNKKNWHAKGNKKAKNMKGVFVTDKISLNLILW